jgi:hypothetical protein
MTTTLGFAGVLRPGQKVEAEMAGRVPSVREYQPTELVSDRAQCEAAAVEMESRMRLLNAFYYITLILPEELASLRNAVEARKLQEAAERFGCTADQIRAFAAHAGMTVDEAIEDTAVRLQAAADMRRQFGLVAELGEVAAVIERYENLHKDPRKYFPHGFNHPRAASFPHVV